MSGREAPSFVTSGGSANVSLITATLKSSQKVLQARADRPTMVTVQLSSEVIGTIQAGGQQLLADIQWQCEGGGHAATVEVGFGTTFTLASAEVVDVTARVVLASEFGFAVGSHDVRVNATAAPATAANPMPAYLSNGFATAGAGLVSAAITVPRFARRFFIGSLDTPGKLVNVEYFFRNAASNVCDDLYGGDWVAVPTMATTVVVSNLAASMIGAITWELWL